MEGDRNLAQCAWNYLNDSLRLDLCLKFRSEVIACAAIFMAIQKINFPVEIQSEWWKIMGATITEILDISERILELYEMPKVICISFHFCSDKFYRLHGSIL